MRLWTKIKLLILIFLIFAGYLIIEQGKTIEMAAKISGAVIAAIVALYWYFFKREKLKPSRHIPDRVKQQVLRRQGGTCCFCNESRTDLLQFHHKKQHALGGSNINPNNIVALCPTCHHMKSKFDMQNKRFN